MKLPVPVTVSPMTVDYMEHLRDQLAVHAPPVPEWYAVNFNGYGSVHATLEDKRRVIAAWPYEYADLVLAARSKP